MLWDDEGFERDWFAEDEEPIGFLLLLREFIWMYYYKLFIIIHVST